MLQYIRLLTPSLAGLWAQSVTLNIVHITSILLIEKWPSPHVEGLFAGSSFRATWRLWANPQLLNPSVTNDPQEQDDTTGKKTKPQEPLSIFLLLRLAKLPLYYTLYTHLLPLLFSETLGSLSAADVADPALLARLPALTAREAVVRGYTALVWAWESLVFLDGANAALSIIFVLSGVDEPRDWPPLFGSPSAAACGLRGFWSGFWHRLVVRPYGSVGRAVARWLRVRGTRAEKSVMAFVVFLLSGLSHGAVSWRMGHKDWVVDVQWFMFNFMACSFELFVLSALRGLARRVGWARELALLEASWLGQLVGYSWVFGFFFWTVPVWRWPRLHKQLETAEIWMRLLSKMTLVPKEAHQG
ncbi:hypothetical protein Daus18300_014279 [Diaporthe australafricana]|uniref:Wax synthase domain-containing protein n=1 Tax=Diaporthe australafricana TaxID=127596 RepID=A0ABR3VVV3_9PEZI